MTPIPAQAAARIGGRSWDFDAVIDRPAGADGVLYATGNQNSGLSIFIFGERLVFDYNYFGSHHVAESQIPVPVGRSTVGVRFRGLAAGPGHALLVIDGAECGRVEVPFVMLILSSIGASVGFDNGSAVSTRYQSPFRFGGAIDRVDFQIVATPKPGEIMEQLAAAAERETMSHQ
jgi:arylsulfatase